MNINKIFSNARCAIIAMSLFMGQHVFAGEWDGPTIGPVKQTEKKVLFISQDFRNGGISTAYRGFSSAAEELGWDCSVIDGKSDLKIIRAAFIEAIRSHQNAIVLGGFQADEFEDVIALAKKEKIILAGWHAAAEPGPTKDLFINIGTASSEVARIAAEYAIQSGNGKVGAIIFNDNRFSVANAKTQRMKEIIERCRGCKVLSVENMLISDAGTAIPAAVMRLDKTYGKAWTHTLAINDVYFDAMNFPLASIGRLDIKNISAGDGSNIALNRIRGGLSQQIATVAEPTNIQGWQLADELNRAFAGAPPSGYVTKPILVTTHLLKQIGTAAIDSEIPYRKAYRTIWQPGVPRQ
jgi:ribose transport system substrate-binding protein